MFRFLVNRSLIDLLLIYRPMNDRLLINWPLVFLFMIDWSLIDGFRMNRLIMNRFLMDRLLIMFGLLIKIFLFNLFLIMLRLLILEFLFLIYLNRQGFLFFNNMRRQRNKFWSIILRLKILSTEFSFDLGMIIFRLKKFIRMLYIWKNNGRIFGLDQILTSSSQSDKPY